MAILYLLPRLLTPLASAALLTDPAVDAYNVHVGTQTFAGLYQFSTNTLLVETAQAIRDLGSDVIKGYLGTDFPRQYHISLPTNVTNLLTLVRDEPSCRKVFDMPFHDFVFWAYPFGNAWPFDGYSANERADDYREMFDLTCYFLTNYNNSGKTFYLGHWEGDWYLLPDSNTSTNPSPVAIQGMIDWLNNRQQAVDDAKAAMHYTNVNVFHYGEVNRVLDATSGNTNINQRMINMVVPYVTNLDCLSYSSYDVMNSTARTLYSTLNYLQSQLPTNKAGVVPGQRIWIGEYGWGSLPTSQQETNSRLYIQRLLSWSPRFILFWEIYNNETNNNFALIDSNNVKVASWYLHQRFLNLARLSTAKFKETNSRLPNDSEFASFMVPLLSQPPPPPVPLALANGIATMQNASTATVSGSLAQGIYGDDPAAVWVFWGRQDGGMMRSYWEQSLFLGINTNFNPAVFSAMLTNLAPRTNYFFRYYGTNSSGEAWAPASTQFSTRVINPSDYGCRMKISYQGYNRGEALLNFPVLAALSTNLPGFSYRQFASRTGGDLRFTDAGGLLLLPHEIDEWNTNGASSVWVRLSQLASSNDFIWAYWGNPLAASLPASSTNGEVWSPNYSLVYHLKETAFPYADSALQHPALSGVAPASVTGQVGHGCAFNGSSQYLDAGTLNLGDAFTLSAWVNMAASATNIQTIWANQKGGFGSAGFAWFVNTFLTANQKLDFASGDGKNGDETTTPTGTVTFGQWHFLSAAVNRTNGTVEFSVDGNELGGSGSLITDFANQADVNLGRFTNADYYFTGTLDEARIQAGTASSNWLWASWLTVASNSTLAAYSSVTQQPPVLSLIANGTAFTLSWPASGVGFGLYSTTNLAPPSAWTLATNQPVLSNGHWLVTLQPNASHARFVRLQSQ